MLTILVEVMLRLSSAYRSGLPPLPDAPANRWLSVSRSPELLIVLVEHPGDWSRERSCSQGCGLAGPSRNPTSGTSCRSSPLRPSASACTNFYGVSQL